ncbi:MAG: hypothetical protein ACTH31_07740, partial [Pseudoclavibacter sp.]
GTEHDGLIVLAPLADLASSDPSAWRVVTPLMGALAPPPVSVGNFGPDVYVADQRLEIDAIASLRSEIPMIPAVYPVQLRADPFLASPTEDVTIVSGETHALASSGLIETDELVAALQGEAASLYADCAADFAACPSGMYEALDRLDIPVDNWSATVSTPPTVTVEGDTVALDGAVITVELPDGPLPLNVTARGTWQFDITTWLPVIAWWAIDVEVTS